MLSFKTQLFNFLKYINALPNDIIHITSLDVGRGLEKQLDEYRELLESIEKETGYFSSEKGEFSGLQAAHLDDYLYWLFFLQNGSPFPKEYLRKRPDFLPK